jgi:hypothetical protein
MPRPVPWPCGGPNQPACPPVNTIKINTGDVIEHNGQKFIIQEHEDESGHESMEANGGDSGAGVE